MSRVSNRTWSKGSSKGEGPTKKSGSVTVADRVELAKPAVRCACGQVMFATACPTCAQIYCAAAGHAAHVCEGGEP